MRWYETYVLLFIGVSVILMWVLAGLFIFPKIE